MALIIDGLLVLLGRALHAVDAQPASDRRLKLATRSSKTPIPPGRHGEPLHRRDPVDLLARPARPGSIRFRRGWAQHLLYTFVAVVIAGVIAIPIGWLIGHTGRGRDVAVAISGAARAPSLVRAPAAARARGRGHPPAVRRGR